MRKGIKKLTNKQQLRILNKNFSSDKLISNIDLILPYLNINETIQLFTLNKNLLNKIINHSEQRIQFIYYFIKHFLSKKLKVQFELLVSKNQILYNSIYKEFLQNLKNNYVKTLVIDLYRAEIDELMSITIYRNHLIPLLIDCNNNGELRINLVGLDIKNSMMLNYFLNAICMAISSKLVKSLHLDLSNNKIESLDFFFSLLIGIITNTSSNNKLKNLSNDSSKKNFFNNNINIKGLTTTNKAREKMIQFNLASTTKHSNNASHISAHRLLKNTSLNLSIKHNNNKSGNSKTNTNNLNLTHSKDSIFNQNLLFSNIKNSLKIAPKKIDLNSSIESKEDSVINELDFHALNNKKKEPSLPSLIKTNFFELEEISINLENNNIKVFDFTSLNTYNYNIKNKEDNENDKKELKKQKFISHLFKIKIDSQLTMKKVITEFSKKPLKLKLNLRNNPLTKLENFIHKMQTDVNQLDCFNSKVLFSIEELLLFPQIKEDGVVFINTTEKNNGEGGTIYNNINNSNTRNIDKSFVKSRTIKQKLIQRQIEMFTQDLLLIKNQLGNVFINLKVFNLSNTSFNLYNKNRNPVIDNIVNFISNSNIEEIYLDNCELSDESCLPILKLLYDDKKKIKFKFITKKLKKKNNKIRILSLNKNQLTEKSLLLIIKNINRSQSLEELYLSGNCLNSFSENNAKTEKDNFNLNNLNNFNYRKSKKSLDYIRSTDEYVSSLEEKFRSSNYLATLSQYNENLNSHKKKDITQFNDFENEEYTSGTLLYDLFLENKKLEKLDLSNNKINDKIILEFTEAFKQNNKITYLNLSSNPITSKGIFYLKQSMINNYSLQELILNNIDNSNEIEFFGDLIEEFNSVHEDSIEEEKNSLNLNSPLTNKKNKFSYKDQQQSKFASKKRKNLIRNNLNNDSRKNETTQHKKAINMISIKDNQFAKNKFDILPSIDAVRGIPINKLNTKMVKKLNLDQGNINFNNKSQTGKEGFINTRNSTHEGKEKENIDFQNHNNNDFTIQTETDMNNINTFRSMRSKVLSRKNKDKAVDKNVINQQLKDNDSSTSKNKVQTFYKQQTKSISKNTRKKSIISNRSSLTNESLSKTIKNNNNSNHYMSKRLSAKASFLSENFPDLNIEKILTNDAINLRSSMLFKKLSKKASTMILNNENKLLISPLILSLDKLKKLTLCSLMLKSSDLFCIMEGGKNIEHLNISQNLIDVKGIFFLEDFILSNYKLCYLNLSNNLICNNGVILLCQYLRKNNSIEEIDLSYNKFDSEAMIEMNFLIYNHFSIKKINLEGNYLTTRGVKLLFNSHKYSNNTDTNNKNNSKQELNYVKDFDLDLKLHDFSKANFLKNEVNLNNNELSEKHKLDLIQIENKKYKKQVTKINLSDCFLKDESLMYIIDYILYLSDKLSINTFYYNYLRDNNPNLENSYINLQLKNEIEIKLEKNHFTVNLFNIFKDKKNISDSLSKILIDYKRIYSK